MSRTQLIGRLGRDPEGTCSASGAYASFSLATHEHWNDRELGERYQHTEWHQIVCYDRLAEIALQFLKKGSEVYVEGRQRNVRWTDKDGHSRTNCEIRVDELTMLRRPPGADPAALAIQAVASIERLARDADEGRRTDVTLGDLARLLGSVREALSSGDALSQAVTSGTRSGRNDESEHG